MASLTNVSQCLCMFTGKQEIRVINVHKNQLGKDTDMWGSVGWLPLP